MTDNTHQCVIIGITGASASGKSLIASTLYRELREQVGEAHIGVIPEDSYYKDQSHLTMEERVKTNYDHPSAMDHNLLFQHLQMLKQGNAIELPQYSYVEHTRIQQTIRPEPKKVIIPRDPVADRRPPAQRAELLHFCRYAAGHLPDAPDEARRKRARTLYGVGDGAVPEDRTPDVPAVYRALQAIRRYHRAARR